MKPTKRNLSARAALEHELKLRPEFCPESTTSGKVHGGFGVIAAFTDREACEETLRAFGFVPEFTFGSFTEWKRKGEAS